MAKRRSRSGQFTRAVSVYRPPAPIIRVSAPRAPKKKHRRSHGGGGASLQKTILGSVVGGAALGFIDKSFPSLPTIPLLGKAGTIAAAAYLFGQKMGMNKGILRDVAVAAAAVAGYQLGHDGHISGDVDHNLGGVASQI